MVVEDRDIVIRFIGAMIDHPSVFMGGPSRRSLRLATQIVEYLENSKRLVTTQCTHEQWIDFKQHGNYCPGCGTDISSKK